MAGEKLDEDKIAQAVLLRARSILSERKVSTVGLPSLTPVLVFCYNCFVMGMTTVSLKIKNPQNPAQIYEGEFLVDSGAQFTVLPEKVWKSLKLSPQREQKFSLADGTVVRRKIGSAFVEFGGAETATPVVLGRARDSFLLGVITLEALGLTLDPFSRQLHKAKLML